MKNVTYINASAGSGKTYTLTHKLAELIKSGLVRPEQVIMTTFTVKAANEMKEEAKKVLYENGLFEASTQLDQAMIGTIHSVANSLIKKYWFFLGLSPDMGVMADEDTQFYISQSLSELPTHEELNQLHAFCESVGIQYGYFSGKNGLNYDFWKSDIEKVIALTTNYEIESYDRSVKESLDFIHDFVHPSVKLDYSPKDLLAILDEHVTFAATQRESKKKQDVLTEVRRLRRGVNAPTISWYKRLSSVLNSWTKCGTQGSKIREELAELWHSELVYKEQERYIRLLFQLAERWKERFRTFKKERNLLDYNDMEKYLRDLLANKELAEEIRMGYRYLFVDEYQDCSPIQVKIFDRLSELMEHSYWVGDYKQAIYGFRGSDITLTKAVVDRIATGENGCDTETLDTSYRSLPGIVEVCNETFKRTFNGVLDEGAIVLKTHRTNDEKIHSVRLWDMEDPESVGIADHIAYLLKQGVNPSDIAVLGRTNAPLDLMAGILTGTYGIPANRQEVKVSEIKCTPLVLALLALVESEKDSLAKAQIAVLTEEGYGTSKIIEEKLLLDADEETKESAYLNDVPLVKRLLELRPMLKQQSVGALIETMVIELDLYNEIKKIGQVNESISCLDTIVQSGYAYEQHCLQMSLPASVKGFVDYLAVIDPAGKGNANGIQLHTYHSSKGLEWKYVILTQLYEKKNDPKKCVKQDIYGIHFSYSEQPSASTPYPEVFIRVIPFIYGAGNTNVPADIQQQIEDSSLYKDVIKDSLAEANRLLYVGMTRPRDVLIVALESHKKDVHTLQWLEDVGLDCVRPDAEHDIFGVGCRFEDDTLTQEQFDSLSGYRYLAEDENMKTRRIPYHQDPCDEGAKYLSPSKLHVKGMVDASHQICEHMHQGTLVGKTMADVGNCIHQIFCGIEQHIDSESYYTNLIDSYGLATYLTDYAAIRNAWEKLVKWLTEQFSAAINIYHERPFTLLKDSNVFTGSIDLVWQTSDGDILIDFKTCPLGQKYILDSDSEHYAGWYAGQLDAYTDALEEAGEKVLKRFIYYPVSGMMCEIGRAVAEGMGIENVLPDGTDDNDDSDEEENDPIANETNSFALSVTTKEFYAFYKGEKHVVSVDVNQDSYDSLLENFKGHLLLVCDEMPSYYYSCYFWNKGMFPYMMKKGLEYAVLVNAGRELVLRIIGHKATVKQRYVIKDNGELVPDANGDACMWTLHFDVEIAPEASPEAASRHMPKTYLLRWNPTISSFRLEDYRDATTHCPNGFGFNWSVYEWEEAHQGDRFYMLRTGDEHAGLVFRGVFTSDPYPGDDWAGRGKQRYYMEMGCYDCVLPDQKPPVDIDALEKALPNIDWRRGHSGQLLSEEDVEKLDELWDEMG